MENNSDSAAEPAHSSSGGWAIAVPDAHLPAARRWLLLGLAAFAVAGLFAVLLVILRIPGAQEWLPDGNLFRLALVIHADLSVLVWFLAFSGFLWTLRDGPRGTWGRRAFALAATGTAFILATPFTGTGMPVLSSYIPVLASPLFLGGLALFAVGIALRAFLCMQGGLEAAHRNPVSAGLLLVACATVLAAFTAARTGLKMPVIGNPLLRYEIMFWPTGHVLQFAYAALALTGWIWLAAGTGLRLFGGPRVTTMLLLSGVLPFLGVPLIEIMHVAGSGEQRALYTTLMRWGSLWPAVPVGLMVLLGILTGPRADLTDRPARSALYASLLLLGIGGGIGWLIAGFNAVTPAHSQGVIGGVTLALMGVTYLLLPRLGYRAPEGRLARVQPWLYAGGQLLLVAGPIWSALLEESLNDGAGHAVAASLSDLGRLLAVIGMLLFLVVCYSAMHSRQPTRS